MNQSSTKPSFQPMKVVEIDDGDLILLNVINFTIA